MSSDSYVRVCGDGHLNGTNAAFLILPVNGKLPFSSGFFLCRRCKLIGGQPGHFPLPSFDWPGNSIRTIMNCGGSFFAALTSLLLGPHLSRSCTWVGTGVRTDSVRYMLNMGFSYTACTMVMTRGPSSPRCLRMLLIISSGVSAFVRSVGERTSILSRSVKFLRGR